VTWALPGGQAAPIASATVTLCSATQPDLCSTAAAPTTQGAVIVPPAAGEYDARVHLTDAAGNGTAANGATFRVRYDPDPPAAPRLGTAQRDGPELIVPITATDPGPAPLTKLTAEICATMGDACTSLGDLAPGTTAIRVAARDGLLRVTATDAAGNTSAAGTTTLTVAAPPQLTPTPPSTPMAPIRRRTPSLKLSTARLQGRTLTIRLRLPRAITKAVTVSFPSAKAKRVKPHRGVVSTKLRLRRTVRRGTLTIRTPAQSIYKARTLKRVVRRR
jgi:hypothetical protein